MSERSMIQKSNIRISSLYMVIILLYQAGSAEIRLPRLISSGMVLQRQTDIKIWGWADVHEPVTLHFLGDSYQTTADDNGEWDIILPKMEAGGPFSMEIIAENQIVLDNILVGEVWVCSGQSNMDLNMGRVAPLYGKEIENSTNSAIRRFFVSTQYDFNTPQKDFKSGSWDSASPETILRFTAVGYFFAKALYEQFHVPIGLIHASVGGSPAEAWLSEEALREFPHHLASALQCRDSVYIREIIAQDQAG
ncbi:MAG: sialate O-acetylesterase, partial [Calditrichaeota bacterium]